MYIDKFIGDKAIFSVEQRMLNITLFLGITTAGLCSVVNYLFEMRPLLITVSIISTIILIALYYTSIIKKQCWIAESFLIVIFGFIAIPVVWIYNGGVLGYTPYLIILYYSMVSVLLRGFKRIAAIVCFTLIMLALIIRDYNNISQYGDIYFGMITTIVIMVTFFVLILNYYVEEKNRATDYLLQIEKQNMEIKMARLDRLDLVGEMAASIGHEVRNPLTTVRGFLQLFQRRKEYAQDVEHLNIMIEELDRANAIITEFLSLAKNRAINLKMNNLNQIIRNLYPLMHASILSEDKVLLLELNHVTDIMVDENEIKQLILNLVRNAREATAANGKITVSTYLASETVALSISDTGVGIPQEIREKLGTPFLTTKEKGTGLGLAICYRIAERHKAKIEVETSSAGTSFNIIFGIPHPI